jgi:aminoglycoside phosphotransferase (APT) family kinase protein
VESQEQSDREICRLIVLGRDGTEVLLSGAEPGLAFPAVEIPRWERLAENLTAALRRDWGCDAVCLITPDRSSEDGDSNGKHYEVMECWREGARKDETVWKPIRSVAADSFQNKAEFRILERCLHQLDCYGRDPSSPFARIGWLTQLRRWTSEVIRRLGLELTDPLRQYNAGPCFNLIRFETNGPAVWFKAVGEPNQREFPITLNLSQQFPKYLPELLGARADWNGWLSLEAPGTNLGETQEIALWERAAESLARLQVESVAKTESILDAGAHDLRTEILSTLVHPFLSAIAQLMEQQTKVPPPVLGHQELSLLGVRIEDSLTVLEDLGLPEVLGHSDLNPGNIVVATDRSVFVDWAEAHVGHPFFSFEYLLEHFRRTIGTDVALESRLARSFSAPWRQLFSDEIIAGALPLAPLAAVFAYATGNDAWKDQERLENPKVAGYFRSLARRMNREAIQSIERRSPCLG